MPIQSKADTIDRRQIGTLLRVPWQRANLEVNRALSAAGHDAIHPAHQQVFQHLPAAGASVAELAQRAQVPEATMAELVNDLLAHNYLIRIASDGIILRSASGWEVERVARETIQRVEDEWGERMGLERFSELCALLAYLANVIDAEPT